MACRVLRAGLGLARAGLVLSGLTRPADAALVCAGASPGEPAPLQSDAEASPFYTLLKQKLGAPSACTAKADDDNKSLAFTFPQGGSLVFTANEAIESSSEEVVLPANIVGHSDAVRLLRVVERSSVPPKGCGIAWSKLTQNPAAASQDAVAEGRACNCRAHLKSEHGAVVGLGFSIAC